LPPENGNLLESSQPFTWLNTPPKKMVLVGRSTAGGPRSKAEVKSQSKWVGHQLDHYWIKDREWICEGATLDANLPHSRNTLLREKILIAGGEMPRKKKNCRK